MKLKRIIRTRPPYDKHSEDPTKDYGVGSMLIWFIVKGPKGAIQFQLNTGGYLAHVAQEWADEDKLTSSYDSTPMLGIIDGWDLGYHSPIPQYKGQTKMGKCDVLDCGYCYYDGTSLGAKKPLDVYIKDGETGLWKYLEDYYYERFGKETI